jgi:hypothetical protein
MMLKPTVYLKRSVRMGRPSSIHPTNRLSDQPTLTTGSDGRLRVEARGRVVSVVVRRCFPWSEPAKFISLRDDDNVEVLLVEDPSSLAEESRLVLEQALATAGFVLEVTRVHSVDEEIEIRHWKVETRQGERTFQTRLDDWPRILPGGGVLIRDVAGDLYHVPAPETMDRKSRELMYAFVD